MIDEDNFKLGEAYLLETHDNRHILKLFKSLSETRQGLCISREDPDDLKRGYGLRDVELGWLSDSDDPYSIGSDELDLLGLAVKRFVSEENRVVLLDGLDFLMVNNPIESVIRLLNSLHQQMIEHSSILLVVLDRSKLEKRNIDILKENLDFEKMKFDVTAGKKERETSSKRKNLVREVREMMDFLKAQEDQLEEDADRMKKAVSMDDRELNFAKIQKAIEELREENRELREELKRVKEQAREGSRETGVEGEIADEVLTTMEDEKRGIKQRVEEIESEERTAGSKSEVPSDLMDTLMDLKEEVKSLRDELRGGPGHEQESGSEIESEPEVERSREDDNIIAEEKFTDGFTRSEGSEEDRAEKVEKINSGELIDEDVFSSGTLKVGSEAKIYGSLEAKKDVLIEEGVTVEGDISSESGEIEIGRNCVVKGRIHGKKVLISSGSDVGDIEAEEEVNLEKETKVENIYCQKDINISEKVEIRGDIYYGGKLDLKIPDPTIKKKTHPIEEAEGEEEIAEERWVSE